MTVKTWLLLASCSWFRYVKIQLLTEVTARAVTQGLETAMNSIGCNMPSTIFCDRGTQLLPMENLMKEGELDGLPDEIYNEVKNNLIKAGIPSESWFRGQALD